MQSYNTTRDRILQLQTLMAQQLAEEVAAARGFGRALVNCVCRELAGSREQRAAAFLGSESE